MNRKVSCLALVAAFTAFLAWSERSQAQDDICSSAVAAAAEINAIELFKGAVTCAREENVADGHFLLILGQIRGMSDMTILEPLNEADAQTVGELYSAIFYQFGGLGSPNFYRTPANAEMLEQRLRETDLTFFDDYDPGWRFKPTSNIDSYAQHITDTREKRIMEMRRHALLWQNDEYFELSQARDQLQRENPTFQTGTPAYDEFLRLTTEMDEIADSISQPPAAQP